jgi:hypothetical protein
MSEAIRIYTEGGPKRTFAVALDWPGWARAGKGEEAAIEALDAYLPRYAAVLRRAGIEPPSTDAGFEVVDRLPATATTDFGALDKDTAADLEPLRPGETERLAAIVAAAWEEFDAVTAEVNRRVSAAAAAHGATYVDLVTPFRGPDGSKDATPLLAPDGDHPDAAGHAVIAEALAAAL